MVFSVDGWDDSKEVQDVKTQGVCISAVDQISVLNGATCLFYSVLIL